MSVPPPASRPSWTTWLSLALVLASGCLSNAPGPSAPAGTLAGAPPVIGVTGPVFPVDEGSSSGQYVMKSAYRDALVAAGALPVHLVPLPQEGLAQVIDRLDGIVLTGGLDINPATYGEDPHPTVALLPRERQEFDFAVAREALRRRVPLLGICLGAQELNVVLGGSLVQDIPSEVEGQVTHRNREPEAIRQGAHPVTLVEGTLLAQLYERQTFNVTSLHHQAVERIGEGLVVAARSPDGVTEAFVHPQHPFLVGVQFHPELQHEPEGLHAPLFQAFVDASRRYRAQRQGLRQAAATDQH